MEAHLAMPLHLATDLRVEVEEAVGEVGSDGTARTMVGIELEAVSL